MNKINAKNSIDNLLLSNNINTVNINNIDKIHEIFKNLTHVLFKIYGQGNFGGDGGITNESYSDIKIDLTKKFMNYVKEKLKNNDFHLLPILYIYLYFKKENNIYMCNILKELNTYPIQQFYVLTDEMLLINAKSIIINNNTIGYCLSNEELQSKYIGNRYVQKYIGKRINYIVCNFNIYNDMNIIDILNEIEEKVLDLNIEKDNETNNIYETKNDKDKKIEELEQKLKEIEENNKKDKKIEELEQKLKEIESIKTKYKNEMKKYLDNIKNEFEDYSDDIKSDMKVYINSVLKGHIDTMIGEMQKNIEYEKEERYEKEKSDITIMEYKNDLENIKSEVREIKEHIEINIMKKEKSDMMRMKYNNDLNNIKGELGQIKKKIMDIVVKQEENMRLNKEETDTMSVVLLEQMEELKKTGKCIKKDEFDRMVIRILTEILIIKEKIYEKEMINEMDYDTLSNMSL
jgi:hypothetical protein